LVSATRRIEALADVVLGLRRTVEQLTRAFETRLVIEQAKGVLMAGRGISAAEAARLLAELADADNATVHDVALRIVHERAVGEEPPPA